jgi:hypothetical protein
LDHLVSFLIIWYISPRFGMFYQEKSGNPVRFRELSFLGVALTRKVERTKGESPQVPDQLPFSYNSSGGLLYFFQSCFFNDVGSLEGDEVGHSGP